MNMYKQIQGIPLYSKNSMSFCGDGEYQQPNTDAIW